MRQSTIFLLLVTFILFASAASRGQETNLTWHDRLSFGTGCGSYRVPGFVLGLDRSIIQHPNSFNGFSCNVRAGYDLNRRWYLEIQGFQAMGAGNGFWATQDGNAQLAAQGLSGSTAGRTNWSTAGATFDFGQHFIARGRWHPFWRAMLGIARLEVTFRGSFNGYSIQDVEGLFPITEPAVDNVTKIIPVVGGEGGLQVDLSRTFRLSLGPYWNTGFGGDISAQYRF